MGMWKNRGENRKNRCCYKNRWVKVMAAVCSLSMVTVAFTGCGAGRRNPQGGLDGLTGSGKMAAVAAGEAGIITTLDVSKMFSDRDKEIGYDEDSCEKIALQDGTVTISKEGSYILSGEMKGSIVVDAGKKDKVQLIFDGVSVICENSAALYVKQADKVFVTLAAGSENLLQSKGEFASSDDNKIDGAIFSKEDITFNGEGSLKVLCEKGHGIVCKDDLAITSGNYEVTAGNHGLQGKDSVRILSGSLFVDAAKDGIHSANDEDETAGYTYIGGGDIRISAGDDGVHSESQLVVADGNLTVEKSYEGLEGKTIEIAGGVIFLKASDDGVNAAGGNDGSGRRGMFAGGGGEDPFVEQEGVSVIISGGALTVDAQGDGLDSNGSFYVNGGEITVYGPASGANGALDYNGEGVVNGGRLIALGVSQMAQNFGEKSTQPSILVNVQSMLGAGEAAELKDASGKVLLSCTAEKLYNSAVFSCPELQVGQKYTVVMGDQITEVELTEVIYGNGMGMGGFHGGKGGFHGDGREFPDDWRRPEDGPDGFGEWKRHEDGMEGAPGEHQTPPDGERKGFGDKGRKGSNL